MRYSTPSRRRRLCAAPHSGARRPAASLRLPSPASVADPRRLPHEPEALPAALPRLDAELAKNTADALPGSQKSISEWLSKGSNKSTAPCVRAIGGRVMVKKNARQERTNDDASSTKNSWRMQSSFSARRSARERCSRPARSASWSRKSAESQTARGRSVAPLPVPLGSPAKRPVTAVVRLQAAWRHEHRS